MTGIEINLTQAQFIAKINRTVNGNAIEAPYKFVALQGPHGIVLGKQYEGQEDAQVQSDSRLAELIDSYSADFKGLLDLIGLLQAEKKRLDTLVQDLRVQMAEQEFAGYVECGNCGGHGMTGSVPYVSDCSKCEGRGYLDKAEEMRKAVLKVANDLGGHDALQAQLDKAIGFDRANAKFR
jgi:hypothetical protein